MGLKFHVYRLNGRQGLSQGRRHSTLGGGGVRASSFQRLSQQLSSPQNLTEISRGAWILVPPPRANFQGSPPPDPTDEAERSQMTTPRMESSCLFYPWGFFKAFDTGRQRRNRIQEIEFVRTLFVVKDLCMFVCGEKGDHPNVSPPFRFEQNKEWYIFCYITRVRQGTGTLRRAVCRR